MPEREVFIMKYIKAVNIYPVNFIRQEESWAKIVQYFEERQIDEDVMLDFENVGFSNPWTLPSFIKLVKMKKLWFKIYHDEECYNTLTALFISEGEDTTRLIFVPAPKIVKLSNIEKKVKINGENLVKSFVKEGDTYCLKVADCYSAISHFQTIGFIEYAMNILIDTQKAKKFLLDFNNIELGETIIDSIGEVLNRAKENNVEVIVDLGTEEEYRQLALYEVANTSISNAERFRIIKEAYTKHPNMVGILTRYKHSDKLDKFGRQGKGESSVSRIAIFRGLRKNKDNVVVAVFQTFNINYFYTKFHWYCEHGEEELNKLEFSKVEVMLPELGFMNDFLGKRFHFSDIGQAFPEENVTFAMDNGGRITSVSLTIPERAKVVFDDWKVKYNEEQLNERIEYTLKKLGLPGYQKVLDAKSIDNASQE